MSNASAAVAIDTSNIISSFDIDMPSVRRTLFRDYGDQGRYFFRMMKNLGYDRAVAQTTTTQYEEDWIWQTAHVGSGGITTVDAPTGSYSFKLGAASPNLDFLLGSTTSPYSSTAIYYPTVKQWDRIAFQGSQERIYFTVTSVSGTFPNVVVAIKQADLTQTFTPANYPADTTVVISGNAFSEGSDQTEGDVSKPLIDHAYLQICKGTFKTTGTQMAKQAWFDVLSDGTGIPAYYIKGQQDAEYRLGMSIDNAMQFERVTTNPILDATTGEPILTTEGHITYAKRKGINLTVPQGSFSIQLIDQINKTLDSLNAPSNYFWGMGIDMFAEKDNTLKAYNQNTAIEYTTKQMNEDLFGIGDDAAGKAMECGFNYFTKSGRTFAFSKMPQWNMKQTWGASGYQTPGMSWFAPIGSKADKKDPNNRIPYFGMIHLEFNGYNRMTEVWNVNGAGPGPKVTSLDVAKLCLRAHVGAEHCAGQLMGVTER